MKRLIYLSMAALMVLAVSCKKDSDGKEFETQEPSAKTLEANEIGAYSARLYAMFDLAGANRSGVSYGFIWGTSEDAEGTYTPGEGSSTTQVNVYSAEIMGLVPETEYWYKAFVEIDGKPYSGEVLTFTTEKKPVVIPEAVDLGIVVNGKTIKWATFNLGATKPEEYGDYYAWGETAPKDDYSWSKYQFGTSQNGPFSKYNTKGSFGTVDNNTELDPGPEGDDVASKILGGNWRMPTRDEMTALKDQCTWAEDFINDVKVQRATGPNGKNIYFPYAGSRYGATGLKNAGSYAYVWSSSLGTDFPCYACYLVFGQGNLDTIDYDRCNGLSVRPVYVE